MKLANEAKLLAKQEEAAAKYLAEVFDIPEHRFRIAQHFWMTDGTETISFDVRHDKLHGGCISTLKRICQKYDLQSRLNLSINIEQMYIFLDAEQTRQISMTWYRNDATVDVGIHQVKG